ncbi:MAG: serine--tRNA ligase [Maricaulaceae bacterium]|jgi:seryl-tRNA synthetase
MHDIKAIRENPEAFVEGLKRRFIDDPEGVCAKLLGLDQDLRREVTAKQEAETARNAASKEIGQAKAKGDEARFEELRAEVAALKEKMEAHGETEAKARDCLERELASLPNLPLDDVPVGEDEAANVEVRKHGEARAFDFEAKDHVDVGEGLGQLDFERAAAMSGARFAMLKGGLAKLERVLAQFMLDLHTEEHGYEEASPPYLVRGDALFGTGQLPKFEEDLFSIEHSNSTEEYGAAMLSMQHEEHPEPGQPGAYFEIDKLGRSIITVAGWKRLHEILFERSRHFLIPTAEVPLTNTVREQILDAAALPLRLTAWTPCFRSEAGSAGKDTRGLIRLHQFHKVELVSIVAPEDSDAELERMTTCAEEVLKRLELPYRVMLLSSGDMGFAARKTYDLEVWLPSQNTYREISSCSNCGDFQARRMDARFKREGAKRPEFVHTLNGSGVAVGRALVAILENYQERDGSVTIPEVLRPYMKGQERIERAG